MRRVLLSGALACAFASTLCAEQAVQPGAHADPRIVFARLEEYLRTQPLEFKTIFHSTSFTMGAEQGEARFLMRHPNQFRIEMSAVNEKIVVISDGKAMTMYHPREAKYATLAAPRSAREGLGIVTGLMATQSPVLSLIGVLGELSEYRPGLTVTQGRAESVGGRLCDGYTIVDQSADVTDTWQVWLEQGAVPLPCKLVTRSSDAIDNKTQTNEFTWTENPAFAADVFVFTPPAGAKEVDAGGLDFAPEE